MRCLICFNEIKKQGIHSLFFNAPICQSCFLKLNRNPKDIPIEKGCVHAYFPYEDQIVSLIYQLKGCKDIALAPVFFAYDAFFLKIKYRDYVLVCAPSTEESNKERGFLHVEEIFSFFNKPFCRCLIKQKDFKQSSLNKKERKEAVKDIIRCLDPPLENKKVLLLDDIVTTGSTLSRCVELLDELHPKKIEIVTLAYTMPKNGGI